MNESALQACVDRHLAHAARELVLNNELGTDRLFILNSATRSIVWFRP